jgi:hypothetical protein
MWQLEEQQDQANEDDDPGLYDHGFDSFSRKQCSKALSASEKKMIWDQTSATTTDHSIRVKSLMCASAVR